MGENLKAKTVWAGLNTLKGRSSKKDDSPVSNS